jgi:hypothetical protein
MEFECLSLFELGDWDIVIIVKLSKVIFMVRKGHFDEAFIVENGF